MENRKNDSYFLQKIVNDLDFIIRHTADIDEDELYRNEILLDSMLFRLIQISENARKVSDSYKDVHYHVPWTAIYGLRNRIVHDYGNVDLGVIFTTLKNDIPDLYQTIEAEL